MIRILDGLEAEERARLEARLDRCAFDAGTTIIREGESRAEMFFVLEGRARIVRGSFDVGMAGPGDHFGELGLLTGRARAATVLAETEVVAGRLDEARWNALLEEDPALASRVVRRLVGALGAQLTEMTDTVSALLCERSLPRRSTVEAEIGAEKRRVRTGTLLEHLLPSTIDGGLVVAAHLDGKAVPLCTPITSDARITPLLSTHWEGERILRSSAALMLLEAASTQTPDLELRLGAPMGPAHWFDVTARDGSPVDLTETAARLEAAMQDLIRRDVRFRHEHWTVEEAIDHFKERGYARAAELLRTEREPTVALVTCGTVYALAMGPVVARASQLADVHLEPTSHGLVLLTGPKAKAPDRGAKYAEVMEGHEKWIRSLGMGSVGAFNRACIDGGVREAVRVSEGFHEKRIGRIADTIVGRDPRVRVVCVAGPSSSGKTTFIKRLKVQLQVEGLVPVELSLDDYYVDRDLTPRDEHGKLDYEALEALDLARLRGDVRAMLDGETVQTPRYDFVTGRSVTAGGKKLALGPHHVLLVEGIHGLNPELFGDALPRDELFRIFIQPMTSLPFDHLSRLNPSDLRLVRRIVRDRHGRGTHAEANILRWPSVRAGEQRNIFPCLEEADVVFDTSLVYEPSVLKTYAERYLLEVPPSSEAYATAIRLRLLLDRFVAIHADHVPPTSILREFIGESTFEY